MEADRRPVVIHQTGAAHVESVRAAYAEVRVQSEVLPFIDDMSRRLAECDLVVCRAGAVTVSELCAAGVPSVLVPLIVSTTSHQRDNALFMAQHGAAVHLPQAELSPQKLAELFQATDRPALQAMAEKAHTLARPAPRPVWQTIERLVKP